MTFEQDAKEIEGLTLEPVGARPDAGDRIDRRLGIVGAPDAQSQAAVVGERQQLVGDGVAAAVAPLGSSGSMLARAGRATSRPPSNPATDRHAPHRVTTAPGTVGSALPPDTPPRNDCNPAYTLDAKGVKRFKPECL